MNKFIGGSKWQLEADYLFDYNFIHQDEKLSAIALTIQKKNINKWKKDIVKISEIARDIAIKNCQNKSQPRHDWKKITDMALKCKKFHPIIMRPDCIIDKNHKLSILEFNTDSAIGGLYEVERIQNLILKNPLYSNKNSNIILPIEAINNFFNSFHNAINKNIAVVGSKYFEPTNVIKIKKFCDWITQNTDFCAYYTHPEDLTKNNKLISDKDRSYGIIYRYRALVHPESEVAPMVSLIAEALSTDTIILSDPVDLLIEHKGIIALLSEYANNIEIDNSIKELIQEYIPWTRFLSNNTVIFQNEKYNIKDLALSHKDKLVLKKIYSHHGDFVFIGNETSKCLWQETLDIAMQEPEKWIIQEKINSQYYDFGYFDNNNNLKKVAKKFVCSPYFFGEYCGGFLVRVSQDSNKTILSLPNLSLMGLSGVIIDG